MNNNLDDFSEFYEDGSVYAPTEADIDAMYISDNLDDLLQTKKDRLTYMQNMMEAMNRLKDNKAYIKIWEQGLEKIQKQADLLNFKNIDNIKEIEAEMQVQLEKEKQKSFGVDLSKSIEPIDKLAEKALNKAKNDVNKTKTMEDRQISLDEYVQMQQKPVEQKAKRQLVNSFIDGVSDDPNFDFDEYE